MAIETPPDQIIGLPHPREVFEFYGNEAVETELAQALNAGTLHHGLIFTGPKGIGKATLAYRLARRYLGAKASDEGPLASDETDEICSKIANDAMPDLRVATRFCPDDQKVKRDVNIFAIRELTKMFALSASNPMGHRVAIVDCADDLNMNSANALLKTLEEPPKGALIILIANSLGAVLPTLRSRSRVFHLRPMPSAKLRELVGGSDDAAITLAKGAYGRALALKTSKIGEYYSALSAHLNSMPYAPLAPMMALANKATTIENCELIFDLIDDWLYRTAQSGLGLEIDEIEPGESATLARISVNLNPKIIGDLAIEIGKLRVAIGNNLDKSAAVIEALRLIKTRLTASSKND
ncbi:MAG: DNA polymerase III subunit delta' [Hyphomonadaceae bacterium]|nr:MAG: DNA polymerase III subunit delta' [Hyphomonadaceae bacterium]KAF0185356.1 MAG: DNA polymerase III subunit delta' [Hyphomonadaceae bacterium]